jgi:hypothetical protein
VYNTVPVAADSDTFNEIVVPFVKVCACTMGSWTSHTEIKKNK